MQVNKDIHKQLVDHFTKIQRENNAKIRQNKYAMKRLVDEQTLLKRQNAAIGELIRNLQPREPKK